jgi:hypothetical protein
MFVRVIEVSGIERFKSFLEKPIFVVRIHEPSLHARASASGKEQGIIANPRRTHRRRRLEHCNRHDSGFEFRP